MNIAGISRPFRYRRGFSITRLFSEARARSCRTSLKQATAPLHRYRVPVCHRLDALDASRSPAAAAQIFRVGGISGDHRGWRLCSFVPQPGYVGAVVVEARVREGDSEVSPLRADCSTAVS